MTSGSFRFDRYCLDPADRQLIRDDGQPLELNARYLDALTLLVREAGKLVSKDRFMQEVWRGVPVTDEALTQCIRTLRKQLGDDVARPRFIETVPKHGYRFIAHVEQAGSVSPAVHSPPVARDWQRVVRLGTSGTLGGGLAGLLGGLFYGFVAASQSAMGALSVVLVIVCITVVVALLGAGGVAFGIAATGLAGGRRPEWSVAGGALGGLLVGAVIKLIGLDAFNLLLGRAPADITGPFEGVVLGATVGLGAALGLREANSRSVRRSAALAAMFGAVAGLVIPLMGGRLMGGSLALLAEEFPGSRLRLDGIGALLGERGFGSLSQLSTGALEGALFGGCVVGAMLLAREKAD
jgi:DNA-binding winged helix-turn-helix (wHTH) protein